MVRRSLSKSVLADLALFSFLKIIAKIHKFRHVLEFRNAKRLTD